METLEKIRKKKMNKTDPIQIMWPTILTNPTLTKVKKAKKQFKRLKPQLKSQVGLVNL